MDRVLVPLDPTVVWVGRLDATSAKIPDPVAFLILHGLPYLYSARHMLRLTADDPSSS